MQPFIKFITDTSVSRGATETAFAQVVGNWKADCNSAFNSLSMVGKCKHLVRQALMVNFFCRVYNKEPWFLFTDYRNQLMNWVENLKQDSLQDDAIKTTAIQVAKMLLDPNEEGAFLFPKMSDLEFFFDSESDTELIPRISAKGFYIPYLYFVMQTCNRKAIGAGSKFIKEDGFKFPLAAIPIPSFQDCFIDIEYTSVPEFNFDPDFLNSTEEQGSTFFKSFFAFLLCMDWSEMTCSQVMAFLSNYALVLDPNTFKAGNIASVYARLWRMVWKKSSNIPSTIVCDIPHLNQLIYFILTLRKKQKVQLDDAQLLASIFMNDNPSYLTKEEKLLVDYLVKTSNKSETSMESYHAFRASALGSFSELDTRSCRKN